MAILNSIGAFAGGLAGGLDQGMAIQQRKQQIEQQKQEQALRVSEAIANSFDPNLPTSMVKLRFDAIAKALNLDPKSDEYKAFVAPVLAMDGQQRASFLAELDASGIPKERYAEGMQVLLNAGQAGAFKWLDMVSASMAKVDIQKAHEEAARIRKGDGEGGQLPDPVAERYRAAGDFYASKGMTTESNAMYAQAENTGMDAQTVSPGTTLGYIDPATNQFTPTYTAPPDAPAQTTINFIPPQYDPVTNQLIPGTGEMGAGTGAAGAPAAGSPGLQKPTVNTIEGDLLNLSSQAQQVSMLENNIRPEWQQIGTRFKMAFASGADKLGVNLDQSTQQGLQDFSSYRANAANLLTSQLKAMSGAAVTPQEAERLLQVIPAPGTGIFDGDSPTVFSNKLRNYKEGVNRATARLYYIKRNGLDGSFISQGREAPTGLALKDMDKIIDRRGDEIAAELARQNPQITPEALSAAVVQQLSNEFGIAP